MMIEPPTLASLAPIQGPSKRAKLNGPTLSGGGGGGYWGREAREYAVQQFSIPEVPECRCHTLSLTEIDQDTCSALNVQGTELCAREEKSTKDLSALFLMDVTA